MAEEKERGLNTHLIIQVLVPIFVMIVTLVASRFWIYGPQIEDLNKQVELLEEQVDSSIAWANLKMLQEDIQTKWPYSREDPVFEEVRSLGTKARDAIIDGDFDTANTLIKEARDLLIPLPGPPIIEYYQGGEEWWRRE